MVRALIHRGPDEQATISLGAATFGVARLSIVDRLEGQQPMNARFHQRVGLIAYNGETYNFLDLRNRLAREGFVFNTRSDTEAVLASHLLWGTHAVEYLDGMYAYAVWNPVESQLLLVRDRLGIKPLYFVTFGDSIAFASEPKALFIVRNVHPKPNVTSILEYFLHGSAFASGYVTHDRSFFEGICAIEPGHLLTWDGAKASTKRYWSPIKALGPLRSGQREAEVELEDALTASVQSMLVGEVPIGTALSGGLDSSVLTALAARELNEPLISACITYRNDHDDPDARYAALLSNYLNQHSPGSHRLEFTHLSEDTYLDSLDEMIGAFDEPHWEMRQLAMFQNYRTLADQGRTIVLTGEGADELLFGYFQKFPGFRAPDLAGPDDFADAWRTRIPWVSDLLAPAISNGLMAPCLADDLIRNSVETYLTPYWKETGSRLRAIQCWYLHTFLPWLLMDNDRCSMAHSLEGRFPFLSDRMVSLALQLPPEWNFATSGAMREKLLLRRAASHLIPVEIWRDRSKAPLPVPLAVSYHRIIANRLAYETENASDEVWGILNKKMILGMIRAFGRWIQSVGPAEGDVLTNYIPLGKDLQLRTSHLFATLTFLRWYQMYFQ